MAMGRAPMPKMWRTMPPTPGAAPAPPPRGGSPPQPINDQPVLIQGEGQLFNQTLVNGHGLLKLVDYALAFREVRRVAELIGVGVIFYLEDNGRFYRRVVLELDRRRAPARYHQQGVVPFPIAVLQVEVR